MTDAGDDDASENGSSNQGRPTTSEAAPCEEACRACFDELVPGSCDATCSTILDGAKKARCDQALGDLLSCREHKQTCDSDQCARESNDLTVCLINYCDGAPGDLICLGVI